MAHHARLSPSGAKQWMTCPGSIRAIAAAIKKYPELAEKSSVHAATGTVAHMIGEKCLKMANMRPEDYLGKNFKVDGFDITVTHDMIDAVNVYVEWVEDYVVSAMEQADIDVEMKLEVWGDLTWLMVDGLDGGTSDCILINKEHQCITVTDYKHGQGVAVEVEDNPQALCYAIGALYELGITEEEASEWTVELVIVQPRAQHPDGPIRTALYKGSEVYDWAYGELVPKAEATHDPEAPLVPSDEGCKFCKAAGDCIALHDKTQELAIADFQNDLLPSPDQMTAEQKMTVADHAEMLRSFILAVENQINIEINAGSQEYEGRYKLVRKGTHRKFTEDAKDPDLGLLFDYLPTEEVMQPKLKSLTDIERSLKKKYGAAKAKELMEELTEKPEGELVVAPQSDKRQEVQPTLISDFEGLDD